MIKVLAVVMLVVLCSCAFAQSGIGKLLQPFSLDSNMFEISAVASLTPDVVGIGGCVSALIATNSAGDRSFWFDAGMTNLESEMDEFVGFSTNTPIGGRTITENTRVGVGWLFEYSGVFTYVRTPF